MKVRPGLAYAQARMQARLSRLPSAADWQRLAGARTLSTYLEEARETGLVDWVRPFSGLSRPHEIDRGCRALARESVEILARWSPAEWRAAIEWVTWLPWLPQLEQLARGEALPAWAALDERLRGLIDADGRPVSRDLAAIGWGPLPEADDAGRDDGASVLEPRLGGQWERAWRARWPTDRGPTARALEDVVGLVHRHLESFRHGSAETAWDLRGSLRGRLRTFLHHHPLQPAALFAYLGIVLLDLERLRGALASRAVFDGERAF